MQLSLWQRWDCFYRKNSSRKNVMKLRESASPLPAHRQKSRMPQHLEFRTHNLLADLPFALQQLQRFQDANGGFSRCLNKSVHLMQVREVDDEKCSGLQGFFCWSKSLPGFRQIQRDKIHLSLINP